MTISPGLREQVRKAARNRCGYCHIPQELVNELLEFDHLWPQILGGSDDESNLWLACSVCNSHKSKKTEAVDALTGTVVKLFNPRVDDWNQHFQWDVDGAHLCGRTPIGRATILALLINNPQSVSVRLLWKSFRVFPPIEDAIAHE